MAHNTTREPLDLQLNIKASEVAEGKVSITTKFADCPGCNCTLQIYIRIHDDEEETTKSEQNVCEVVEDEKIVIKVEPIIAPLQTDLSETDVFDNANDIVSVTEGIVLDTETKPSVGHKRVIPRKKKRGKNKQIPVNPSQKPVECYKLCPLCYTDFNCDKTFRTHVANHDLTCHKCSTPTEFKSHESLRKHVKRKHFSLHPKFESGKDCPKCGKRYINSQYPTHVKRCRGKPECSTCGRTCKDWSTLQAHIKAIHEGQYDYICHICGSTFASKNGLDAHGFSHGEKQKFECDHCKKSFKSRYLIAEHMKKIHLQIALPIYTCEDCGKTFHSKAYFRVHKINHLEVKPHVCQTCFKGFAKRDTLLKHEMIHTDTRKHGCTVCDKMFRDVTSLTAHFRLHSGEKPYCCEICQRRFHDRGCYRTHLIKHEKEMNIILDKSVKRFRKNESTEPIHKIEEL